MPAYKTIYHEIGKHTARVGGLRSGSGEFQSPVPPLLARIAAGLYSKGAMNMAARGQHIDGQPDQGAGRTALRHPLVWLLLLLALGLVAAAGRRGGQQAWVPGAPAEGLYRLDGWDGLESGGQGPFRWTHPLATMQLPGAGPGALTLHLTLFDGAPAPRALRISLDAQEIYRGQTRSGGALWTLDLPARATIGSPRLLVETAAWTPPGDRRQLGVALTGLTVDSPDAAGRAMLAQAAFGLAVLLLVVAAARCSGVGPAAVAGLGVLGVAGPLLAYGDPWLTAAAPAALVGAAIAAGWPARSRAARRAAIAVSYSAIRNPQSAILWTLALTAGLLLLTLGRFNTGDAEAMYQITAGLGEDGVPWGHKAHDWLKFGLGQPLLTLPLYALGRAWAAVGHGDVGGLTRFCVALFNQAVIPATALALALGARRRYGGRVALALVGTFLLATPALPYARLAFAEPMSGLLILSASLLLWTRADLAAPTPDPSPEGGGENDESDSPSLRRGGGWGVGAAVLAGLCLGIAVLVKPANAIYVPIPTLYLIWDIAWTVRRTASVDGAGRWVAVPRLAAGLGGLGLGLLPGLALTLLYNQIRYSNPFVFGYEGEGFTTPLATGLYGLLVSSGKGIVWFAPPLLLAPLALVVLWRGGDRRRQAEVVAISAQVAVVLVFHALWSSWEGNIAWGPRLILPLVPLLLWPLGALAAGKRVRRVWWLLGALGWLVNIPGALIDQFYYFDLNGVYDVGTTAEAQMLFTPSWSQIVAHWRFLLTGTREAVIRPLLASFGLPPWWDIALPVALTALGLGALVAALRVKRKT